MERELVHSGSPMYLVGKTYGILEISGVLMAKSEPSLLGIGVAKFSKYRMLSLLAAFLYLQYFKIFFTAGFTLPKFQHKCTFMDMEHMLI